VSIVHFSGDCAEEAALMARGIPKKAAAGKRLVCVRVVDFLWAFL
jgi:hypothetical protein